MKAYKTSLAKYERFLITGFTEFIIISNSPISFFCLVRGSYMPSMICSNVRMYSLTGIVNTVAGVTNEDAGLQALGPGSFWGSEDLWHWGGWGLRLRVSGSGLVQFGRVCCGLISGSGSSSVWV